MDVQGDAAFKIKNLPNEELRPQLPKKTRIHTRKATEASFNRDSRRDYLTGFRKRKQERQKLGKEREILKAKAEKTNLKKERNKRIYGDMAAVAQEWDTELAEEKVLQSLATSETVESAVMEFGEGDSTTVVSIEPFGADEDEQRISEDKFAGLGSADILRGVGHRGSTAGVSGLITSKQKRDSWKPNSLSSKYLKHAKGDDRGGFKMRNPFGDEIKIRKNEKGEEVEQEPEWKKHTRSKRPPPSMGKQNRQKWIQGQQLKRKSKTFKVRPLLLTPPHPQSEVLMVQLYDGLNQCLPCAEGETRDEKGGRGECFSREGPNAWTSIQAGPTLGSRC
jgi:hypothetical protein